MQNNFIINKVLIVFITDFLFDGLVLLFGGHNIFCAVFLSIAVFLLLILDKFFTPTEEVFVRDFSLFQQKLVKKFMCYYLFER